MTASCLHKHNTLSLLCNEDTQGHTKTWLQQRFSQTLWRLLRVPNLVEVTSLDKDREEERKMIKKKQLQKHSSNKIYQDSRIKLSATTSAKWRSHVIGYPPPTQDHYWCWAPMCVVLGLCSWTKTYLCSKHFTTSQSLQLRARDLLHQLNTGHLHNHFFQDQQVKAGHKIPESEQTCQNNGQATTVWAGARHNTRLLRHWQIHRRHKLTQIVSSLLQFSILEVRKHIAMKKIIIINVEVRFKVWIMSFTSSQIMCKRACNVEKATKRTCMNVASIPQNMSSHKISPSEVLLPFSRLQLVGNILQETSQFNGILAKHCSTKLCQS